MQRLNSKALNNAYMFVTIHTRRAVIKLHQRLSERRNMAFPHLTITFSSFFLGKSMTDFSTPTHISVIQFNMFS